MDLVVMPDATKGTDSQPYQLKRRLKDYGNQKIQDLEESD